MKNEFSEYYRPTKKEFKEMWDSCDFIFDTNILLNLYRYSIDTRNTLIEIMEQIDDRIWIPYQVGFEYHTKRISVIEEQKKAYDQIKKKLTDFQNEIEDELLKLCNSGRHPYINCDDFLSELTTAIKDFFVDLDEKKEKHPELLDNDPIRNKLTKLFTGRICDQLDPNEKEKVINQGEDRYKKQIPPGFKDDGFGDLLIWFEMINHAKKRNKSIIFVTDDRKEDWWLKYHGKTIGPRPEIIKEILENAGIKFYMYSADKFMRYAKEYLKSKVEQKAIEEAKEIRLQEEREQAILEMQKSMSNTTKAFEEAAKFANTLPAFAAMEEAMKSARTSPAFAAMEEAMKIVNTSPAFTAMEEAMKIARTSPAFAAMEEAMKIVNTSPAFTAMEEAMKIARTSPAFAAMEETAKIARNSLISTALNNFDSRVRDAIFLTSTGTLKESINELSENSSIYPNDNMKSQDEVTTNKKSNLDEENSSQD